MVTTTVFIVQFLNSKAEWVSAHPNSFIKDTQTVVAFLELSKKKFPTSTMRVVKSVRENGLITQTVVMADSLV